MTMTFDASELRDLAADLGRIPAKSVPAAMAVVSKGAYNVKTDWQARWKGLSHAPSLADAVTYEMYGPSGIGQHGPEIGPDKLRRQGALGNIIEYGTVKNSPTPGGLPAAEAEAPRFAVAVAQLGESLL